jgi:steroid 5-alpha reductase family enzyme
VLVLLTALWAVSVVAKDSSIVDVFWGSGFVIVAWAAYVLGDGSPDRRLLLVLLVTVWGLRLTAYLARRNLGTPEDYRYAAMRRRHGERWALRSLVLVFWLQGALIWVVSLPVQVAMNDPAPAGLGVLDWIGVGVWVVGLTFEAIGDWQLARFKAEPTNWGKVMDSGLWRYTRHPNYFGECCVWWGFWLIAAGAGGAWTIFAPLLMTWLLLRVSGVTLLEKDIGERRPGYAEYVRRTNAFIPGPRRA